MTLQPGFQAAARRLLALLEGEATENLKRAARAVSELNENSTLRQVALAVADLGDAAPVFGRELGNIMREAQASQLGLQ